MASTSTYLEAGKQLKITADAASSGTLIRLSNLPGGGAQLGSTAIAAGSVVTVGPFSVVTRWEISSAAGLLSYEIALPGSESDQAVIATNGVASGTGVSAAEYPSGLHKTVLTLASLSVAMTDATTAGAHGSQKVYDFPAGPIHIMGASFDLTTAAGAGGLADNAALVGSLGSVTVGVDNATLTTTEADIIASTAGTLSSGAGTLKKHGSIVTTAFDGTTTPVEAFLNLAVPDAGSTADDTITVSGRITIYWINLDDY